MNSIFTSKMNTGQKKNASIEDIWSIQEALGGERHGWHPYFQMNDRAREAEDPLDERPESVEEWGRPDLDGATDEIGDAVEEYLEDRFWMDNIDDGAVDLVVEEGSLQGSLVQAKGAIVLAKGGKRDSHGRLYSRPGGFYMREDRMEELAEAEKNAILYTVVHYPRREHDTDLPVLDVNEEIDTAVIGELAFPAEEVYRRTDFDSDGKKYWKWSKAYGERPDTSETVDNWYRNSFLEKID